MLIRSATTNDTNTLTAHDKHISRKELENSIQAGRVYIAEENKNFAGWLRYNLFWDNTPFMNMIYLLDENRKKGFGRQLVTYWESQMKLSGYKIVMTSTASDEYAQHFYHKLGYSTIGGFLLRDDPYEIILAKYL